MIARFFGLCRSWLARVSGPCPFWHRTLDRIRRHENQRVIYECALCGRDVSEALKDEPKGTPIPKPKAVVSRDHWWRNSA